MPKTDNVEECLYCITFKKFGDACTHNGGNYDIHVQACPELHLGTRALERLTEVSIYLWGEKLSADQFLAG